VGEPLRVPSGAILIASLTDPITFERQAPTPRMPQKARFEKPAVSAACISINSLRAKCQGTRRGMQVLSFHIYCTLSSPCTAPRLTVILARTDIKTACTGFPPQSVQIINQAPRGVISPKYATTKPATTIISASCSARTCSCRFCRRENSFRSQAIESAAGIPYLSFCRKC